MKRERLYDQLKNLNTLCSTYKDRINKTTDEFAKVILDVSENVNIACRSMKVHFDEAPFGTVTNIKEDSLEFIDEYQRFHTDNILYRFEDHYIFKENMTVVEAVQEIDDGKSRYWLPRRKNKALNERIDGLDKIIPVNNVYKTRGILYPNNVVTIAAYNFTFLTSIFATASYYSSQIDDFGSLLAAFSLMNIALTTAGTFLCTVDSNMVIEKPDVASVYKTAKYVDDIIEKVK